MNRPSLLVLLLLLCGCATTQQRADLLSQSAAAIDQAKLCCTHLSGLAFQAVEPGKTTKYVHDRSLQAFAFGWGRSFAKGFALPEGFTARRLWIESRLYGDSFWIDGNVVAHPFVLLLDRDHEVIAQLTNLPFRYTSPWTSSDGMEAEIPLPPSAAATRYVVIATGPSDGSLDYCTSGAGAVVIGNIAVPTQSGQQCFSVPFSFEGKIGLRIE